MTDFLKGACLVLFFFLTIQISNAQKHEWVKYFTYVDSTYSYALPSNIDIDKNGGILTSGHSQGRIDFDPGIQSKIDTTPHYLSGFINKLDSNGFFQHHQRTQAINLATVINETDLDFQNNTLVAGQFYNELIFNKNDTVITFDTTYHLNGFILKLDVNGNRLWAKTINSKKDNACHEVVIDQANNVYVLGFVEDTADINPEDTAQFMIERDGQTDYIMKLDSNGVFQWAKTFDFNIWNLGINQFGHLFFVGNYSDTLSLATTQNGTVSLFPLASANFIYGLLDNQAKLKWIKSFHSDQQITSSTFEDFPVNQKGHFHHFGTFVDNLYLGDQAQQKHQSLGEKDGFLHKVDTNGNTVWLTTIRSEKRDITPAITGDDSSNIFLTLEGGTAKAIISNSLATDTLSLYRRSDRSYILKINSNGNLKWAKEVNPSHGFSTLEAIDWQDGNLISTGMCRGNIKLDSNTQLTLDTLGISTYILKTKDCEPTKQLDTITLCQGDSSFIPNIQVKDGGTYLNMVPNYPHCDRLIQTHVTVLPSYFNTTLHLSCDGSPIWFQGEEFKSDTALVSSFQTIKGCDSILVNLIQIDSSRSNYQSFTLCKGDSINVGDKIYKSSGIYRDTFKTVKNCDSIVISELNFYPTYNLQQSFWICSGDTITVGSNKYFRQGFYRDSFSSSNGCDSIIKTQVNVYPQPFSVQQINLCENDTFYIGTSAYTKAGIFQDTLPGENGCDSLVYTQISLLINAEHNQTISLCKGESFQVGDSMYTKAGNYENIFEATNGCDSIVRTHILKNDLSLTHSPQENLISLLSSNQSYQWLNCDSMKTLPNDTLQNFSYTQSGTYAVVSRNAVCSDTSDCIQVNYYEEFEFKLYPNPSKNNCIIEVPSSGQLRIFDLRGSLLKNHTYSNPGRYQLELHPYAVGVYLVKFSGVNKVSTRRLIITK